jgi:hypothetical protein
MSDFFKHNTNLLKKISRGKGFFIFSFKVLKMKIVLNRGAYEILLLLHPIFIMAMILH